MKRWLVGSVVVAAVVAGSLILVGVPGTGQTTVASYTPPRTADGHPDLQGVWQTLNTASWDLEDHQARLGVPAGQGVVEGGEIPYQPWALAKKKENLAKRATLDPGRAASAGRAAFSVTLRWPVQRPPRRGKVVPRLGVGACVPVWAW